jgi:hypothetical protein
MFRRTPGPTTALPLDPLVALERAWLERGAAALICLRERDPGAYVRLIARLVR